MTMSNKDLVLFRAESYALSRDALIRTAELLEATTGFRALCGCELEFYVTPLGGALPPKMDASWASLTSPRPEIAWSVVPEVAPGQFELRVSHAHPVVAVDTLLLAKAAIITEAGRLGLYVDFRPRPYAALPGNALHLHLSLVTKSFDEPFTKSCWPGPESEVTQMVIAGLCYLMRESMIVFCPTVESYKRLRMRFVTGPYRYANAPKHVSWGGNNRTVAIRIPDNPLDPSRRHLEHRVPGADADPYLSVAAILIAASHGIEKELPLILPKSWGECQVDDYTMTLLPQTLSEAGNSFNSGSVIKVKLPELLRQ
jgi:glutamine synthetase